MSEPTRAPGPGLLAPPRRADAVMVTLTGRPAAVIVVARALADVVVVTGMSHHAGDASGTSARPVIRLDATCYPPAPR